MNPPEEAEREVLADVAGSVLFTRDALGLFEIRRESKGLFGKLLDFLKKLLSVHRGSKVSREIRTAVDRYRAVVFEEELRRKSAEANGAEEDVRHSFGRGYMDGGEWSIRANEALEEGLRPAAMIARDYGVPVWYAERVLKSKEWHHVGKDFERVDFYEEPNFFDDLRLHGFVDALKKDGKTVHFEENRKAVEAKRLRERGARRKRSC